MKVLKRKADIVVARRKLVAMGVSAIDSPTASIMRRLGFPSRLSVGDIGKSWDVLQTINFVQQHIRKDEPILDMGAFASEVIVALHKLGYQDLTGADLDPRVKDMPHHAQIKYEVCDFMGTGFSDESFAAITSISVIEHGYNGASLFKEVARVLRPGGYFTASFDYWQSKVETGGIKFFNMSWIIFSEQDIHDLIETAGKFDLHPVSVYDFAGAEKPIRCAGKDYTFGWIVLQKGVAS